MSTVCTCENSSDAYFRLSLTVKIRQILVSEAEDGQAQGRTREQMQEFTKHLAAKHRQGAQADGPVKSSRVGKRGTPDGQNFKRATWLHRARELPNQQFKDEVGEIPYGRARTLGADLLQGVSQSTAGD